MSYNQDDFSEFENEYNNFRKNQPKAKIMLIGGTGVGKSSLINKIFGINIAEVGHGIPTSRGVKKIEIPERDIILYDSEGYEIGENQQKHFNENILSQIEKEGICAVWYCISAPNSRITDLDMKIIKEIARKDLPISVVLTQGDKSNPSKVEEIKNIIKKELGIFTFLVTTIYIKYNNYGNLELNNLIKWTSDNIPQERIKLSFVKEQKCNLKAKELEVIKIINQHSLGNTVIGASPIPFSDAPLLLASQMGLIARIIYIYDLESQGDSITSIVESIGIGGLIQQGGKMSAKYAFGQIIKFFPGAGTIVGGIINGGIAGALTKTLGETVSLVCYKIKEDEINNTDKFKAITSINPEIFIKIFQEQAKRVKNYE